MYTSEVEKVICIFELILITQYFCIDCCIFGIGTMLESTIRDNIDNAFTKAKIY